MLLDPRTALTVGMAIHELTTNAVKYGSLSVPEGIVDVAWRMIPRDGQSWLEIVWTERNGPPVVVNDRRGFGTALVERGFRYDLGGEASIDFAARGVIATLRAPCPRNTHEVPT